MGRLKDTEDALREITRRVDYLADVLHQLDTGGTFETMTCGEIEALADVLRIAGRGEVAEFIVGQHAEHDEEGDLHWTSPEGDAPLTQEEVTTPAEVYRADDGPGDLLGGAKR